MANDQNASGRIRQADYFLYCNIPNATDQNLSMFNQSENRRLFHKTLDDLLYSTQQMVKNNKQVDFIIRDLSISTSSKPEEKILSSSIINNTIIPDTKIVDKIKQRIIDTITSTEDFDKTWRENFSSIVKNFVHDVSLRHADYADNVVPERVCNSQCVGTETQSGIMIRKFSSETRLDAFAKTCEERRHSNLILDEITRIFDTLTSAEREKTDSSSRITLTADKMEEEILEKAKSIIYAQEKPSTVTMEAVRSTTVVIQRKTLVDSQVSISSIHFVQELQYPLTYLDVTDEWREAAVVQVIEKSSKGGIARQVSSISLISDKRDFQNAAVIDGLTTIAVKSERGNEEEKRKDDTIFLRSILDTVTFAVFQHIAIISTKDAKVVKDDKKDEKEKDIQVAKVAKVDKKEEKKDVKVVIDDRKKEEEKYVEVAKDDRKKEEEKYVEVAKDDRKEEEEKYVDVAKDDRKEEEEKYVEVAKDDRKEEEEKYVDVAKDDRKEEEEKYVEVAKDDRKGEEEKYVEVAKDDRKEEEEKYVDVAKDDRKEEEEKYVEVAKDDRKKEEEKYVEVAKDDRKEKEKKYVDVAKHDRKEEEEEYIEVARDDKKEEEEKDVPAVLVDMTIGTTTVDSLIIDTTQELREDSSKIVSLKYKMPKYRSINSLDLSHISKTLIKHDYLITKKEKMPLCKKIRHPDISTCTFFSFTSFEPTRRLCCERPATKMCPDDQSRLLRILQPIRCCRGLIPSNIYLGKPKYCDIRTTSYVNPQIAATREATLSNVLHPSLQDSRAIGYHVSCRALTDNKNASLRHCNINCYRKHRPTLENSLYVTYDTRCKIGMKYYYPRLNNIDNIRTGYYHCNNNCPIWNNNRHCERNQLHQWSTRGNLYFIHPWTSRHLSRYN